MKMQIHTDIKNRICLTLKPEVQSEEAIIEFLVGKGGSCTKFEGFGDAHNGLVITSERTLKQ